ncbi:MAG: hypothetical protein AAFR17_10545 [Pseudomonadota bacterium]
MSDKKSQKPTAAPATDPHCAPTVCIGNIGNRERYPLRNWPPSHLARSDYPDLADCVAHLTKLAALFLQKPGRRGKMCDRLDLQIAAQGAHAVYFCPRGKADLIVSAIEIARESLAGKLTSPEMESKPKTLDPPGQTKELAGPKKWPGDMCEN